MSFIRLLSSRARKIRFGFAKSNTHTCADRIQLLTFECQNVCQKGFNTIMHRICPDVVPELSSVLTVGRATADYPAMGFNKRKTEDARWPRCSRLGMSFSTCRGKRPANQRSRPGEGILLAYRYIAWERTPWTT